MKVTNCTWELANLGRRTVEILIEPTDAPDPTALAQATKGYEYIVVKVPAGRVDYNIMLAKEQYFLIETQISLTQNISNFDFDDRLVRCVSRNLELPILESDHDFYAALEHVTPGMFVADRIALDPHFSLEDSCRRYKNWFTSAHNDRSATVIGYKVNGTLVGMGMHRLVGDVLYGLLGGTFADTPMGLGLLTVCAGQLFVRANNLPVKTIETNISANNTQVAELYSYCHYTFRAYTQVYVKHVTI
ncbi:MAG: hypothetical protein IJ789_03835 [Bacteroidales bacterium]|nr:hypothetical protein [Bacteroidales bacterium]